MALSVAKLLFALNVAGGCLAAPYSSSSSSSSSSSLERRQSSCDAPKQRRAWHTLSNEDKRAYIRAEQCLMNRDANLGLYAAQTMFDELQSTHVVQAEITHLVGAFLPFHRLLLHAHEHLLASECGYTQGQPYWEETLDAGNFAGSVVLDPETGFGGNGASDSRCIQDGPFSLYTNQIGPSYQRQPQCITRAINETASAFASQARVDECMARGTWLEAWPCIEGNPHFGGHNGIGAQMSNPISSPGDPLFYLHHAWLDKLWWDWQSIDLENRLYDMGGRNEQNGRGDGERPCGGEVAFGPRPEEIEQPLVQGDPGCATTLDHVLDMKGVVSNQRISSVMNIQAGALCYEYV